jgi:hypothetical protein
VLAPGCPFASGAEVRLWYEWERAIEGSQTPCEPRDAALCDAYYLDVSCANTAKSPLSAMTDPLWRAINELAPVRLHPLERMRSKVRMRQSHGMVILCRARSYMPKSPHGVAPFVAPLMAIRPAVALHYTEPLYSLLYGLLSHRPVKI